MLGLWRYRQFLHRQQRALTFLGPNVFTAGSTVDLQGFAAGGAGLNGQTVTVSATGLTSNQWSAAVVGGPFTSDSGQAVIDPTSSQCQGNSGNGKLPKYGNNTPLVPLDLGTGPFGSSPAFNTWVSTLLAHVSGTGNSVASNIAVVQLMNEVDLCVHSQLTPAQLYALVQYPAQLIRATIPGVVIMSPSMTPASGTNINCFPNNSAGGVTAANQDLQTYVALENSNGVISDVLDYHVYLFINRKNKIQFQQWH